MWVHRRLDASRMRPLDRDFPQVGGLREHTFPSWQFVRIDGFVSRLYAPAPSATDADTPSSMHAPTTSEWQCVDVPAGGRRDWPRAYGNGEVPEPVRLVLSEEQRAALFRAPCRPFVTLSRYAEDRRLCRMVHRVATHPPPPPPPPPRPLSVT